MSIFRPLNLQLSSAPTVISFGNGAANYEFAINDFGFGPEVTVATTGTASVASAFGGPVDLAADPSLAAVQDHDFFAYPDPVPIPYSPGVEFVGLAYQLPDGVHYGDVQLAGATLLGFDENLLGPTTGLPGRPHSFNFFDDQTTNDLYIEFGILPGSPLISSLELPFEPGVASYEYQYEHAGSWLVPVDVLPGTAIALTDPSDRVVIEPLDEAGNPIAISGDLRIGVGFAGSAPGSISFNDGGAITPATLGVYRFFDTTDGTHFFTASDTERQQLSASRPDLMLEGTGLNAVDLSSFDPNADPVYRFFSKQDGTHFFTASATERDGIEATRSDLAYEGTGFYEHLKAQQGDTPVYRFFDTVHGTHLYTENAGERASIISTRGDLTDEGVAFYAPQTR